VHVNGVHRASSNASGYGEIPYKYSQVKRDVKANARWPPQQRRAPVWAKKPRERPLVKEKEDKHAHREPRESERLTAGDEQRSNECELHFQCTSPRKSE